MNNQAAKVFSSVVLAERTMHIKLLGDSITHGVGGTGFEQNGEPITAGFARNPDGYCWAKQFKEHLESQYNCTVTNNGCTGTTIEFILDHLNELVLEEDDIILCTIGTNNRHQYLADGPLRTVEEHKRVLYECILKLNDKLTEMGKKFVFVANIPADAVAEDSGEGFVRLFHMWDVNDLYMKASCERGFAFISMYYLFLDYCEVKGIPYESLLADGLHPNDAGYDVMYKLLMKELGLGRKSC